MKAVLFAAGRLKLSDWLLERCQRADLLVAVDGGLSHLLAAGLRPDLLVGDLDSASPEDLAEVAGTPRLVYPADKSRTDLELALDEVERRGAREVLVAAALGKRQDHNLTNLLLAAAVQARRRLKLCLAGDGTLVWPLAAGQQLELPLPAGTLFSVIATSRDVRLSLSGARYALSDEELPLGTGLGVSNEVLERGRIEVHSGTLLLMVPSDDV